MLAILMLLAIALPKELSVNYIYNF